MSFRETCQTCNACCELRLGDNSFFACKGYKLCDGSHFCPSTITAERDALAKVIEGFIGKGSANCAAYHECVCSLKNPRDYCCYPTDCPLSPFVAKPDVKEVKA